MRYEADEYWEWNKRPGETTVLRGRLAPEPDPVTDTFDRLKYEPVREVLVTPGQCVIWHCEEPVPEWPELRECLAHRRRQLGPSERHAANAERKRAQYHANLEEEREKHRLSSKRLRANNQQYRERHARVQRARRAAATYERQLAKTGHAEMNWYTLYWRAYEWGANEQRLKGHQLDQFAHAYADIYEPSQGGARSVRAFWTLWLHGHIVPNPSGTYHYEDEVASCRVCHTGVWNVAS